MTTPNQNPGLGLHTQHVNQAPAADNLLEYRAETEYDPMQGTQAELRQYFDTADRLAAARRAMATAYRGGREADAQQQQEFDAAHGELRALTAERGARLAAHRTAQRMAQNQNVTPAEIDQITQESLMEELSLGIITSVTAEARLAPPEVQRRGNAVTRGLRRVLGSRAARVVLYTAAAAGIVVGALTGALAPMAIAGATGAVVSPIVRRVTRHFQGRNNAHAEREARNTAPEVEARNNLLLQTINTPLPGEDYQGYMERVRNTLYRNAVETRTLNRNQLREMARNSRRVGFGRTLLDIGQGAIMGAGLSGLIHGVEAIAGADAGPAISAEQAARTESEMIRQAISSGDPNQLHDIPGLQNSDIHTLQELAAADGGRYSWDGMRNILENAGLDHSDSAIREAINNGVSGVEHAHANGLGIDIEKVMLDNGNHYFKVNVTDPNLVIMQPVLDPSGTVIGYDSIPLQQGPIQGVPQAELFHALNNGQIVTADQALRTLGETAKVTPDWLAARMGEATRDIAAIWNPTWNPDMVNVPEEVLIGATGGAATAIGDIARRRPSPADRANRANQQARTARVQQLNQYLTNRSPFVNSLPGRNQVAFINTINRTTGLRRMEIAQLVALQNQQALAALQNLDRTNP